MNHQLRLSLFVGWASLLTLITPSEGFSQTPLDSATCAIEGLEPNSAPWGNQASLRAFYPSNPRTITIKFFIVRRNNGSGGSINNVAEIDTILNQTNQLFSGTNIIFQRDPVVSIINSDIFDSLNSDAGETNQLYSTNSLPNVLNIYFVTAIRFQRTWGIAGLANTPGRNLSVSILGARRDSLIGSVSNLGCFTLAHEIGHNFGLYHTHGNGVQEFVNQTNYLTAGDFILDTPAEPYYYTRNDTIIGRNIGIRAYSFLDGCTFTGRIITNGDTTIITDPNGDFYTPGKQNGKFNHMAFTGSVGYCQGYFSYDQICVMHWAIENNHGGLSQLVQKNVAVANRFQNQIIPNSSIEVRLNTSGGTVTVPSGSNAMLLSGSTYRTTTSNERFNPGHPGISISNPIKHNNWDNVAQQFNVRQNLTIQSGTQSRDAYFAPISPATVRAELLDAPSLTGGTVEVKDPWYVADATGAQPNAFIPFASPYNITGAFNQTTGGAFLNQIISPGNPFYSVRAGQSNTISGFGGQFYDWQASNATLQNPTNLESGVRFNAPNATVTARYKGRLLSSLANATSSGSQRTFANAQGATLYNNVFYLVYESAGKIWLTYSANGGTTWSNELYLGDGKNPTVAASSQNALLAWNTGSGQLNCRLFSYDPVSPSLSPTLYIPYGNRVTPDAKVVIATAPQSQSTINATLFCEVSVLNNPSQTRLGGVRVSFSGNNGAISSVYDILNSPIYSSPNAPIDIAAIQEEAAFGSTIHLVHTNYGTGAPYPVYYATITGGGTMQYNPMMQLTDNTFATWQPKNLTLTLDSLNNKHLAYDAHSSSLNTIELVNASGANAVVNRIGSQFSQTESVGSVPTKFALHQNYPNPFNPVTVIRYELPTASVVKLQLFDVLGRVVTTLVNKRRDAGIYEAVFNASTLSSGTYSYRLQAGSFIETKKLVLVK